MRKKGREWIVSLSIAALIIIAAIAGKRVALQSEQKLFSTLIGDNYTSRLINENKWILTASGDTVSSVLYIGKGKGYNDNITIATFTDTLGDILSVRCLYEKETPSFYKKISKNRYLDRFVGQNINDVIDNNRVDIVAGATISSSAIAEAVKDAYINGENLDYSRPFKLRFGLPETLVSILLLISLLLSIRTFQRYHRVLLPISWILSVVYLGFYLGQLLTLPRFITVFTGYLPDIGTEFYIILIVVFATLAVLFSGKNLYCKSVCPFGAAQDIIGHIGGAKAFRPKRYRIFKSLQWGITLAAILLALSINNPGVAEYSVFGAFFQLTAASTIFILLIITIALSLFIKRPWCNYLCPIDGVFAYFRTLRRALLNLFSI